MRLCHLSLLAALNLTLLAAGSTFAFQPQENGEAAGLAVSLPILEENRLTPFIESEATIYQAQAATAGLPGRWEVRWNRLTGTPHRIVGSGLDLRPGGFAGAADVDATSRAFVAGRTALAGVEAADLKLLAIENGARHWSALYEQTHRGIPVEGARVDFVYSESGRLVMFGSDAYRTIETAPAPALNAEAALAAGSAGLPELKVAAQPELRILPVPTSFPDEEELRVVHHLAYRMTLETAEPLGRWVTWVDAQSGQVLWRYDDIHYLEVTGQVTEDVEDFGYCEGVSHQPNKDLTVNVSGVASVFTDASGNYSATVPDNTLRSVTAMLRGRRVRLQNNGGANASFAGSTTPGNPLNIVWTNLNSQADERDVYLHTTRNYDFIRALDPTINLMVLDTQLLANVSINDNCNAFWNGSSINFYREGGGCANTGRIGDVIYHEYGHGVTQVTYSPQSPPGDLHEGNSDIIAAHLTEVSIIGNGFFLNQCGSGIRDCDNTFKYPDDVVGQEGHFAGQVICGFDWDARRNLEVLNPSIFASHSDSLWHYTRKMFKPMTQPAQVNGYFLLDDNDGDISNESPHYAALCPAAVRHGFTPPGPAATRPVTVAHTSLHSTTNTSSDYEVVAVITSTAGPIDVSQTDLHYRLSGGPEFDVPMTATGNPNEYHAFIPASPVGTRVSYTMTTADQAGNEGAYPQNPCVPGTPNGTEVFHVATTLDEEVASGWTVGAAGDNAVTGVWVRVDPNGTGAQPENDRTPAPGTICFVTGQGSPGGPLGENDVDGGTTTLLTPILNLSTFATAEILYHRWYSNNTGATPGTDFWVVDVSNDGGASWVNVENTNLTESFWKEVRININNVFGGPPNQVRLRFVASDLGAGSLVEAGVDEFMIFGNPATVAVEEPAPVSGPTRFALGPIVPNPFNPATTISFDLPERAALSLFVYDVNGRLVRTLADHLAYEAGSHDLTWDGRDDRGVSLSSGVYHVRMAGPRFFETRKVVMVK